MKRIVLLLSFVLVPLALISGCDVTVHGTNNSSQGDNDYFEEPVSERSMKYSPALETSNKFVEFFAKGQLADARNLLDPRLQEAVSEGEIRNLHEQVLEKFGSFIEFKPMQWGFSTSAKLDNIVVSIKIVVHEGTETFYVLNFEDNGVYDRIVSFNITPRSDGERVAQAAARAHGRD